MALIDKLKAIADAIRGKTGNADSLTLDQMAEDLNAIPNRTADDVFCVDGVVYVSRGNYQSDTSKSVETATQVAPTIEVSSSGLITATAGTQSATKQLSTQAAKTVTPKVSAQIAVMAGKYTTGAVTVAGDINLKAANIKSGVSIFGVTGTYEGNGGSGDGSIETCSVKLINGTTSDLVAWHSVVSNGEISSIMNSASPGSETTITNVPRNSVFSFLTMRGSMGSVNIKNAMLVSSCEHLGAVVAGTSGTEVSVTVNAPTT